VIGFATGAYAADKYMLRNASPFVTSGAFLTTLEAQPFVAAQEARDPHGLMAAVHDRNTATAVIG
jgi:hypothetical protein